MSAHDPAVIARRVVFGLLVAAWVMQAAMWTFVAWSSVHGEIAAAHGLWWVLWRVIMACMAWGTVQLAIYTAEALLLLTRP